MQLDTGLKDLNTLLWWAAYICAGAYSKKYKFFYLMVYFIVLLLNGIA